MKNLTKKVTELKATAMAILKDEKGAIGDNSVVWIGAIIVAIIAIAAIIAWINGTIPAWLANLDAEIANFWSLV